MVDMSIKGENLAILDELGRLRRGINLMAVQILKPVEVGPKQALILSHLYSRKTCSLADLSRSTITDPAATGRTVDTLIKRGWIDQREHPTDRRQWVVQLTSKGKQIAREVERLRHQLATDVISKLSHSEKKTFALLVRKLISGVSAEVREGF
jgi:DNA-binding MarR family transcriptional regulator